MLIGKSSVPMAHPSSTLTVSAHLSYSISRLKLGGSENLVGRIGSHGPLHGVRKSGIGLAPGNLYVRGECGPETLLQRPEEGSSD